MMLVHSTQDLNNVRKILKEGIRPGSETGIGIYGGKASEHSNAICFSLIDEFEYVRYNDWGNHHFILSQDYFLMHKDRFRVYAWPVSKFFLDFVKRTQITPLSENEADVYDQGRDTILSLDRIPIEGIDSVILGHSGQSIIKEIKLPQGLKVFETFNEEIVRLV